MSTDTYTPRHAFPRSNLLHYPIDRITEEEIGRIREREGIHAKHKARPTFVTDAANLTAKLDYPPLAA